MMRFFPPPLARLGLAFGLGVTSVALVPTTTAAAAGNPTAASHLEQLEERTRELLADRGTHQHARTVPPALALGDCGEAGVEDPDEGMVIDIGASAALADCNGELAVGILTYDEWDDDVLASFAVGLDTDRNPSTGCEGFEYSVIVIEDAGSFPGAVFPETSSCTVTDPVAEAYGGRGEDRDFVAVAWDAASVGSPASFSFVTATRSDVSSDFDFAPDPGQAMPVLTIRDAATPAPPPRTPAPGPRSTAPACTFPDGFEDGFGDVPPSNGHEQAIDCIVYWQVTTGSQPGIYGPTGGVTRGQMASFLARFVERSGATFTANAPDAFRDDDGSPHEANINKLAAAGIAAGKGDGTFSPNGPVLRSQMATFIVRAIEYRLQAPVNDGEPAPDYFTDDDGDAHEANIGKAAAIGITGGTRGSNYSPQERVRRDQMASFLARALAEVVEVSDATIPPPPPKCATNPAVERTDVRCR